MKPVRNIAFGYSTNCNIRCGHCVAAGERPAGQKMGLNIALDIIHDMAASNLIGISFTAGEPFLFFDDLCMLVKTCKELGIYSRVVTNGFWAKTRPDADKIVFQLLSNGLAQLRISCSRWHQEHISIDNVINAAQSCINNGLDYFISFVTDFSQQDDALEQLLRDNQLNYFPEPVIYFGRAEDTDRKDLFTDYYPNICSMNPYLTPELDMYACCDGADNFSETDFLYLGNLRKDSIEELFKKKENNILYNLIKSTGLSPIATSLGMKASEIVQYRKCELCQRIFNSKANIRELKMNISKNLIKWRR